MGLKYVKSTARLLGREYVNNGDLDVSKELLVKGQQSCGLSKLELEKKLYYNIQCLI